MKLPFTVRLILYTAIFCGFGLTAFFTPIHYTWGDLKDFINALIAISGIIFTIMGIWIAFLYPSALSRITSDKIETADFTAALSETKRLESLVASILQSALVASFSTLFLLAKVIFSGTPFYLEHQLLFKSVALSFCTLLSFVQFEAVGSVIAANILFLNDLHSKRERREQDQSL